MCTLSKVAMGFPALQLAFNLSVSHDTLWGFVFSSVKMEDC